jgi:hypothetical protein
MRFMYNCDSRIGVYFVSIQDVLWTAFNLMKTSSHE